MIKGSGNKCVQPAVQDTLGLCAGERIASKEHWNRMHCHRLADSVSWYQVHARCSQPLIKSTGALLSALIINVDASTLLDDLLGDGYRDLTVSDLLSAALAEARARLGELGDGCTWVDADITDVSLPAGHARVDTIVPCFIF